MLGDQEIRPRRSWWGRNWKWFLPVTIITPLLMCGGFVGLLVALVFGVLRNSVAYQEAVAAARREPAVVAAIGAPIEEGLPMGNIEVSGGSGYADLRIPISGPQGSATIYVAAERWSGEWYFDTLEVKLHGQDRWIDLLAESPQRGSMR